MFTPNKYAYFATLSILSYCEWIFIDYQVMLRDMIVTSSINHYLNSFILLDTVQGSTVPNRVNLCVN